VSNQIFMKKLILLLGICLLFTHLINAQDNFINGKVIDGKSNQPLSNVLVECKQESKVSTTDQYGNFSISVENNRNVKLVFSLISYEPTQKTISLTNTPEDLTILLFSKSEQLDEVEILGTSAKDHAYRTEFVGINKVKETNLQDVGDLLRNVPNMGGIKKGAMGVDPVIRGFKYSQLNVQLNGGTKIEGGCPNRMDPATAHIEVSDLKNIIVLKGPFALKYGVNFGGVIDMTTYYPEFYNQYKTNVTTLLGAQTNHTGAKTKVGVSGANQFVTYNLSGSWKKYGDYQDGNGEWVPAQLQQQNLTASLGFKIAEKHLLYATTDFSRGKNIDFPTLPMDERSDNTNLYSLNYFSDQLGESVNFIRAKTYYSDVHHEMDNKNRPFSDTVVAVSTIHAVNTGAKLGVNFNLGEAKMEVGGDYENIYKNGTRLKTMILQPMLPTKQEDLWNNARINNLGIFAEYNRPGQKLDWTIAARLDFNSASSGPMIWNNMAGDAVYQNDSTESSFVNFSISGGLEWHLGNAGDIVFSLGRGARGPDMTERFIILLPTGYDPYDYLGNPQLKPEVNHEIDLGYRFSDSKIGSFDLSGFFSLVTNYISASLVPPSEVKPQTKGVLGVKKFINIDKAYLSGFELTYNTPNQFLWGISWNMAYTEGWNPAATAQIIEDGKVVGEETINNDPLPEIPPYETNIAFSYKFFHKKLVPSVSFRIVAAQNRVSQAYNEQTSPGFTLINLALSYQFNKNLQVYGGVRNLLNTNYYEHLNRNIIGTQYPLYEPGIVFYANLIFNI